MSLEQTEMIKTQKDWTSCFEQERFSIARFTFELEARQSLILPPYKGSALRGGFGMAFKKTCCAIQNQECANCQLNQSCAYAYIFETPSSASVDAKYHSPALPHPFIIEPPLTDQTQFEPGETLRFGLVLIGKSIQYLPYFIFAFHQLGEMGLGKGRGKYCLKAVYAPDTATHSTARIYDDQTQTMSGNFKILELEDVLNTCGTLYSSEIQLQFLTPTRIVDKSKLSNQLNFSLFIRTLLRRISLLGRVHCGSSWDLPFTDLIRHAEGAVQTRDSKLTWVDWERYSNRQKRRMTLGGVTGTVTYVGSLKPFLPLILLGEYLHIGKNTTFGLGKYLLHCSADGKMSGKI